ncbi:MAG: hypothetical protein ACYTFZ_00270 [Planctomycetota bacterium]|jgi:histone H3/H4
MPFLREDPNWTPLYVSERTPATPDPEAGVETPGVEATWDAALRLENSVVSARQSNLWDVDPHVEEPGFSIKDWADQNDMNHVFGRIAHIRNSKYANAYKAQLDDENEARQTMAAAGWVGIPLTLGAAFLDPLTIWMPGGAAVKSVKGGYSALKTAGLVGLAGGSATAAQEAFLHMSQETRTGAESAINIGAGTVLSALLGAGLAKAMNRADYQAAYDAVRRDMLENEVDPDALARQALEPLLVRDETGAAIGPVDGGAAAVQRIGIEDLEIAGTSARVAAKVTARLRANPMLYNLFSASARARQTTQEMVDTSLVTQMNLKGETTGPSVEAMRAEYFGRAAQSERELWQIYKNMQRSGFRQRGGMSWTEFRKRVGAALRTGDLDRMGDPNVSAGAKIYRERLFDWAHERGVNVGAFDAASTPRTARSYFHRVWDRSRLVEREAEFKRIIRQWLDEEVAAAEALPPSRTLREQIGVRVAEQAQRAAAHTGRSAEDIERSIMASATVQRMQQQAGAPQPTGRPSPWLDPLDREAYINEVADNVFDRLTGRARHELMDIPEWLVPATRGPLKERSLLVPDELVREFLEDDVGIVSRRYAQSASAEIELRGKFGKATLDDQVKEIRDEYRQLREENPDRVRALHKEEENVVKHIEAFRDLLRGTYNSEGQTSNWGAITRSALALNYMRLLGGVTLSSLPDLMRLAGTHGFRETAKLIPRMAANLRDVRLSVEEARSAGAVVEGIMNQRLLAIADLMQYNIAAGPGERGLLWAADKFSKATGLPYWNDMLKGATSILSTNRIVRTAMDWDNANKFDKQWMAQLGLGKREAEFIRAQVQAGTIRRGDQDIWVVNSEDWIETADLAARRERISRRYISERQAIEAEPRPPRGQRAGWADQQARRIRDLVQRYRTELNQVAAPEREMQQKFRAALTADVNRTIVTPGIGDRPLWSRTNTGSLVMQFKSFMLASHQRVLLSGLQGPAHRFWGEQLMIGMSIGMMVTWLKLAEKQKWEEIEKLYDNPAQWMALGLDRSGIFSIPWEISNNMEKLGIPWNMRAAAQALGGEEDDIVDASRFASRNKSGALLGPSLGLFEDILNVSSQLAQGDVKKSGVNAIVRSVPGQNLPWATGLGTPFNIREWARENLNETFED